MNYEFHPEAELEVVESAAWYESEVPGLGLEFGEEVERVIELLLEHPELGAAVDGDIRHFVASVSASSCFYYGSWHSSAAAITGRLRRIRVDSPKARGVRLRR